MNSAWFSQTKLPPGSKPRSQGAKVQITSANKSRQSKPRLQSAGAAHRDERRVPSATATGTTRRHGHDAHRELYCGTLPLFTSPTVARTRPRRWRNATAPLFARLPQLHLVTPLHVQPASHPHGHAPSSTWTPAIRPRCHLPLHHATHCRGCSLRIVPILCGCAWSLHNIGALI